MGAAVLKSPKGSCIGAILWTYSVCILDHTLLQFGSNRVKKGIKEWKPSTEDSGMVFNFDKTYSCLAGKSDKIGLFRQD